MENYPCPYFFLFCGISVCHILLIFDSASPVHCLLVPCELEFLAAPALVRLLKAEDLQSIYTSWYVYSVDWPKQQLATVLPREVRKEKLQRALRLYRCLELLNQLFNCCFTSVIIPEMKIFSIVAGALTTYAVIKHRTSMHPLMEVMIQGIGVIVLGLLVLICLAGSKFHDNTKRFHYSYEHMILQLPLESQKYFKRAFAACPTFGFRVGNNVYVITKITIATALYSFLSLLMFLLLTY